MAERKPCVSSFRPVASADLRLNEPRYVSLPNILKAKKKPLEEKSLAALGIANTPGVRVLSRYEPPRARLDHRRKRPRISRKARAADGLK